MSFLVISEILELFVDTLTTDYKYSLRNSENLQQPIQMSISKKQITFSEFFALFLKSKSNVEHFEKDMRIMADVFPKSRIPKNGVR